MLYWNGTQWVSVPAGSNGQFLTLINGIPVWEFHCGTLITISHVAGAVAPVTKTVAYGTVDNIPGVPLKCWITSNLGSDHQATSVNDATEPSAGWYWQFNHKQGYQYISSRIPSTTWISNINEITDWIAANDPCTIELGAGWRIPTSAEWTSVDASGSWTDSDGPWSSALKMHTAGFLNNGDGFLNNRGTYGYFWSSTQVNATSGSLLNFGSTSNMLNASKAFGFSVRCLRDL
jgi:uncharacterized protein (TIGR02145 family)